MLDPARRRRELPALTALRARCPASHDQGSSRDVMEGVRTAGHRPGSDCSHGRGRLRIVPQQPKTNQFNRLCNKDRPETTVSLRDQSRAAPTRVFFGARVNDENDLFHDTRNATTSKAASGKDALQSD